MESENGIPKARPHPTLVLSGDIDDALQKDPCFPQYQEVLDCREVQEVPKWKPCQNQLKAWKDCVKLTKKASVDQDHAKKQEV